MQITLSNSRLSDDNVLHESKFITYHGESDYALILQEGVA